MLASVRPTPYTTTKGNFLNTFFALGHLSNSEVWPKCLQKVQLFEYVLPGYLRALNFVGAYTRNIVLCEVARYLNDDFKMVNTLVCRCGAV